MSKTISAWLSQLRIRPGDDTSNSLPALKPDWQLVTADVVDPGGETVGECALRLFVINDETSRSGLPVRIRRAWQDLKHRDNSCLEPGAIVTCTEKRVLFEPVCPACARPLEPKALMRNENTGGEREPLDFLLYICNRCDAGGERAFGVYTQLPDSKHSVAIVPFDQLVAGWRPLVKSNVDANGAGTANAAQLNHFPCANCTDARFCYNLDGEGGPLPALQRLAPLHWSSVPPATFPSPLLQFRDYLTSIEQKSVAVAQESDPELSNALLSVFERKLTLFRAVAAEVLQTIARNKEPIAGFDASTVAVHTGARRALRIYLQNLGGPLIVPPRVPHGLPVAHVPVAAGTGSTQSEGFNLRGTLECTKLKDPTQEEGGYSIRFGGKVSFDLDSIDRDDSKATIAIREYTEKDMVTLLIRDTHGGIHILNVQPDSDEVNANEIRFNARTRPMDRNSAQRLHDDFLKKIPVTVYLTPIPGFEADLWSLARIGLLTFTRYDDDAGSSFSIPDLEFKFVEARIKQLNKSGDESIAALRENNPYFDKALHQIRIFGKDGPPRRANFQDKYFPMMLSDEMLTAISNWLATPRRDATEESLARASEDITIVERRARLFGALRNDKLLRHLIFLGYQEKGALRAVDMNKNAADWVDDALSLLMEISIQSRFYDNDAIKSELERRLRAMNRTDDDLIAVMHFVQSQSIRAFTGTLEQIRETKKSPSSSGAEQLLRDIIGRDRAGLAFLSFIQRLHGESQADAIERARKFADSEHALRAWTKLAQISIKCVARLALPEKSDWPPRHNQSASAMSLLEGLYSSKPEKASLSAMRVLLETRGPLIQLDARISDTLKKWCEDSSLLSVVEHVKIDLPGEGKSRMRDRWEHLTADFINADDFRNRPESLRDELISRLDAVHLQLFARFTMDINPNTIEQCFRVESDKFRLNVSAPEIFKTCAHAIHAHYNQEDQQPEREMAKDIAENPRLLLSWVLTSEIGLELLLWCSKNVRTRSLSEFEAPASKLLNALRDHSPLPPDFDDHALDGLAKKFMGFASLIHNIDGDKWDHWLFERSTAGIIKRVEEGEPAVHFLRKIRRWPRLWTRFENTVASKEYSPAKMFIEFQDRLFQQLDRVGSGVRKSPRK
ncbi:MAG: hypothetical protein HY286_10200 [Planctomycetes bacterium]|nr:hypothetical protein [Planctomycetota bacterium]